MDGPSYRRGDVCLPAGCDDNTACYFYCIVGRNIRCRLHFFISFFCKFSGRECVNDARIDYRSHASKGALLRFVFNRLSTGAGISRLANERYAYAFQQRETFTIRHVIYVGDPSVTIGYGEGAASRVTSSWVGIFMLYSLLSNRTTYCYFLIRNVPGYGFKRWQ